MVKVRPPVEAPSRARSVTGISVVQRVLPVSAGDGSGFELICVEPAGAWTHAVYWLPAMGMPARHYLAFAEQLAERGIAVALHEWRGIGSSDVRAGRHGNWGYRELLALDLPAGAAALRQHWPAVRCCIGGHSLGGQLAMLAASLEQPSFDGLLLVASGAPYWRCFGHPWLLRAAYVAAPLLAGLVGYLPGRRLGFAGNEARGVIRDWAGSGRSGRYAASGMLHDFAAQLALLRQPLLALRLQDDWMVPAESLDALLQNMPHAFPTRVVLTRQDMCGAAADHFSWMKAPAPLTSRIASWIEALPGSA